MPCVDYLPNELLAPMHWLFQHKVDRRRAAKVEQKNLRRMLRSTRMKSRIYIETSVISYLTSRPSRDLIVAAHQEITREWWAHRRNAFAIAISALVIDEASRGDPEASQQRLNPLNDIESMMIAPEAVTLAEALVSRGALPATARADAVHVALRRICRNLASRLFADVELHAHCQRRNITAGDALPQVNRRFAISDMYRREF